MSSPPAHIWVPERRGSLGDEACDLMEMVGRPLDDAQRIATDAILSYGPGGRWVALESGLVISRQCGKTAGVITAVVLFDLFCLPADEITWTAHLFPTARKSFEDIRNLITGCPELSRRVKKIREANGEEGIELHLAPGETRGAELNFLARSKGGGRGMGGKRVVMDEALFLPAAAMEALLPTLSARPNPHVNYASSAGLETSEQLHALAKRGRAGGDPSLVWIEWKAEGGWDDPPCERGVKCPHTVGTEGCYLDDEDAWARAVPALDDRISREYVRSERRALRPAGFGRERLGWFEKLVVAQAWRVIPADDWTDRLDATFDGALPTLALEVEYDRSSATIAAAGIRDDGRRQVGLIEHRPGTEWVLAWAEGVWAEPEHPSALVVDPKGPAGALIPDLRDAGVTVIEPDLSDLVAAYTRFVDGCKPNHDTIRHSGDAPLDHAVKVADNRAVGDRLAWDRKDSGVAPVVAASLAAHFCVARLVDPMNSIW